jgi:hypothetical protein
MQTYSCCPIEARIVEITTNNHTTGLAMCLCGRVWEILYFCEYIIF